ncbi:MAG: hypothetical protein CVV44_04160 [Spirochaetae bacterium HGW-Spirochaetae-1]|nr:MAG: hypothetical protein CVV44_04160 [Spirochaetae bacterium HGW-Spirochaetae-1]
MFGEKKQGTAALLREMEWPEPPEPKDAFCMCVEDICQAFAVFGDEPGVIPAFEKCIDHLIEQGRFVIERERFIMQNPPSYMTDPV